MPNKGKVSVRFALNMCALDPKVMPKGGMIVVPARPPGTWYAVCSNESLSATLANELDGQPEASMGGFTVCSFKAGEQSDKANLKSGLEQLGYEVVFVNSPPWQSA